jgi:hypothetical protein
MIMTQNQSPSKSQQRVAVMGRRPNCAALDVSISSPAGWKDPPMLDFVRAVTPRSWFPSGDLALPELDCGQREAVCIQAILELGGRVISCTVVEISARNACVYLSEFVAAHDAFIGQLGLLRNLGGPAISVAVRSFADMSLNLKFLNPVGLEAFCAPVDGFRSDPRRSERAQVEIRSQIIAGDQRIDGTILNISGGGALVRTDEPSSPTGAIMIESELMRPMWGYIRWRDETLLGIMFNRLLSIPCAEEIAEIFSINPIWLQEIIEHHRD